MGEEFASSACRLGRRATGGELRPHRAASDAIYLPSLSAEKFRLLQHLLQARNAALELGLDVWEFALDLQGLRATGISDSEIRWAVVLGYAEHRAEVTAAGEAERSFRAVINLQLTDKSCFVLTAAGQDIAKDLHLAGPHQHLFQSMNGSLSSSLLPHWDAARRTLSVSDVIVKEYRVPAANQELILAAFEELCWPIAIDDPLPPRDGLDPKRRLHDTINSLNRNQQCCLLKFRSKSNGQGVSWEFRTSSTRVPPDPV